MVSEKNKSQEFRLKNIDETTNYLIEDINQNELISRKHKKVCRAFNYIQHLLILVSTVTRCISISAFASLVGIPIGIMSSVTGSKICVITAGIKKYISIIKKKKKSHEKILSLSKFKSNRVEALISRALINSNISHNDFVLIKVVPKEFDDMKEEIKNSNDK